MAPAAPPPSSQDLKASLQDLEFASIFFGIFIGLFIFTAMKVVRQAHRIWKRTHSLSNFYLWAILVETIVNLVFATTTYLYLRGNIPPSLGYFTTAVTLWTIQTQLFLQIIANRVGLIMLNKQKSRLLKWILFIIVALINISVFCIWIPALMGVSQTYITLNHIWERVEKTLFLLLDAGMNVYFLYLVRSNLVSKGLTKYTPLFNFNAGIVVISIAMDAVLLGMLSLPNSYDYVQFSPIVYIAKLYIELTMAELISKVVRSAHRVDERRSDGAKDESNDTRRQTMQKPDAYFPGTIAEANQKRGETADSLEPMGPREEYLGAGIMKTVTTLIGTDCGDDESVDSRSETTTVHKSVGQ